MNKKALTAAFITGLLFSVVAGTQFVYFSSANFFPDPSPDLPRIYIRSNGNVEPATAPIERTGNIYKLTGNIVLYTIEIQRDNIVLDGAGYTIQGNASRIKGYDDGNNGVIVVGRNNVNITRLNFEQGDTGVRVSKSSNVNIIGNTFSNGITKGISLQDSTLVLIEANNFTDLQTDIGIPSVRLNGSKITFKNNTLTGRAYGVEIKGSSNVISDNKIEIAFQSIRLNSADSNIIARNKISGDISLVSCSNNMIFGNNLTGIRIIVGSNNTIFSNYMANDLCTIELDEGAVNNTFYGNTFAVNCSVRINDAGSNFWDNGTIGNYWGNYNGTDSNRDGIGDAPYTVVGYKWDNDVGGDVSFVAGYDNFPLMEPYGIEHDAVVLPQTEPFLAVLVAAVAVAVAVVIDAGLLLHLKKRSRGRNT